jgi:hypothetical protein
VNTSRAPVLVLPFLGLLDPDKCKATAPEGSEWYVYRQPSHWRAGPDLLQRGCWPFLKPAGSSWNGRINRDKVKNLVGDVLLCGGHWSTLLGMEEGMGQGYKIPKVAQA